MAHMNFDPTKRNPFLWAEWFEINPVAHFCMDVGLGDNELLTLSLLMLKIDGAHAWRDVYHMAEQLHAEGV